MLNVVVAQTTYIKGCIHGYSNKSVVIQDFYGEKNELIDTLTSDSDGCFTYFPGDSKASGQIRLLFEKRQFLDFFYDKESLSFTADFNSLMKTIEVESDLSNKLYYDYLRFRIKNEVLRSSLLKMLTDTLDPQITSDIHTEINYLHSLENSYIQELKAKVPGSLVSKVIALDMHQIAHEEMGSFNYLRDHFFDEFNFNDTILLRTNAVSAKIITYLSLSLDKTGNFDTTLSHLTRSAYYLIHRSLVNQHMFEFMSEYLVNGFNKMGYKDLAKSIDDITFPCCLCIPSNINDHDILNKGNRFPKIKIQSANTTKRFPVKKEESIIILAQDGCYGSDKLIEESKTYNMPVYIIMTDKEQIPQEGNFVVTDNKSIKKLPQTRPLLIHVDNKGKIRFKTHSWLEYKFMNDKI